MVVPYKVKYLPTLKPSDYTSRPLPLRNKNKCLHKDLYMNVHRRVATNGNKTEISQVIIHIHTRKNIWQYCSLLYQLLGGAECDRIMDPRDPLCYTTLATKWMHCCEVICVILFHRIRQSISSENLRTGRINSTQKIRQF